MKSKDYKWFFSIFSGTVYKVEADEASNLDDGQIPLLQQPASNCTKCYGRGWEHKDVKRGIYVFCTKCAKKCADPSHKPKNIWIPLANNK